MMVSLVGAGPGDPGLLTLKGRDALAKADAVVYDALASPALLAFARPDAELIYVGKIADQHALPQAEINALLVKKARENKLVVRLKGGDPYVFGRGGEEAEYLRDHGVPFEEIPGISSAIAAPAYAGIPLTHRDLVSSVCIVTGHENPDKNDSAHNWQALAQSGSTLVFVMGMKNLPQIVRNLLGGGMDPQTPAALIYRGSTPMQRSLTATLEELPQRAAKENFSNPSVIVIGKVATLRDKLDWFSQKPLLGKRIVVTRAREQASDIVARLSELGASVIECPSIEIRALPDYGEIDAAIARLRDYAWLIFTSVNGVRHFWARLENAGFDSRALSGIKIAAIGPATAAALADKGVKADLTPRTYVAESLAAELIAASGDLSGKRVLIPRAAKARVVLPEELNRAGAITEAIPVYETVPATGKIDAVKSLLREGKLDCVSFGSSSTVENFLSLLPASELAAHPETALAAIGPITARTLADHGLNVSVQPEEFAIPALVKAITAFLSEKQEKKCH